MQISENGRKQASIDVEAVLRFATKIKRRLKLSNIRPTP
jgi:hypothetical protein